MNISSPSYATDVSITQSPLPDGQLSSTKRSECLVVNLSAVQLHDDSEDVMSTVASNVVNNVVHMVLYPALFLLGFPSNLLNLLVFFKHGLHQRINLCLFWLALMDIVFVSLAFLLYVEKLGDPDFEASYRNVGRIAEAVVNNHVLGLYAGSVLASQFVSAVISGERCLCVVWPMRSASVLTTKATGVVLLVGTLVVLGGRFLVGLKFLVICLVDVTTGMTSYLITESEFYTNNKKLINTLDGAVYGVTMPAIWFFFVTITTAITAANLRKSTEFQKESSSSSVDSFSARNLAVTKMLICLSIQFILLNTPNMLFRVFLIFFPDLSASGSWVNLFFFLTSITEVCGILSSSLNFLVYFIFGSKYRETVLELLCLRKENKPRQGVRDGGVVEGSTG